MGSPDPLIVSRRTFLRGVGALGGIAVFGPVACGGEEGGVLYSGEAAITHLTAIVHSAPFHIAEQEGYYEEAELEIEHVSFSGGSETIRGLEGIPFGSPSALPVFIAYQAGRSDLRIIGSLFNAASVDFLAPVDAPFDAVEELEGLSVAVSTPGSNSDYFAKRTLTEAGYTLGQDVEIVNVGGPGDSWTAASQGVVDVAWSAPPLSNKLVQGDEAKVIWRSSDFVENWTDTCLVTNQGFIDENPEALRAWVAAVQRGIDLITSDPEQAAEIYGAAVELDPEVALDALVSQPEGTFDTAINRAGLEENIQAGLDTGQLSKPAPSLDEVVDESFLA